MSRLAAARPRSIAVYCAQAALAGQRLRVAAIWVSQRRSACGLPPLGAAHPLSCHQPCRAVSSDLPRLQPAPIIRNGASRRHGDTVAAGSILWRFIAGFAAFAVTAVTTAGGDGARQAFSASRKPAVGIVLFAR